MEAARALKLGAMRENFGLVGADNESVLLAHAIPLHLSALATDSRLAAPAARTTHRFCALLRLFFNRPEKRNAALFAVKYVVVGTLCQGVSVASIDGSSEMSGSLCTPVATLCILAVFQCTAHNCAGGNASIFDIFSGRCYYVESQAT